MKTGDMIQTIKDNLGDRNSGRIGGRDVDTVVLEALNLAVPHCVLEAQPDYYNRTAQLDFKLYVGSGDSTARPAADETTVGAYWYDTNWKFWEKNTGTQWAQTNDVSSIDDFKVYSLPTVDTDNSALRIKNIYGFRCRRSDGTDVNMVQLNYRDFVNRTRNYQLNFSGTPGYFALWGKENKIHLDYIPSEIFTFTMYVEAYPQIITSAAKETPLPLDDQWNIVVEAFATKHCYLKLQQIELSLIWEKLYLDQKASISREESVKQSENIYVGARTALVSDPVLDPFVSNWNN